MNDTYWVHYYFFASVTQYLLGNGMLRALQFMLGCILIQDTVPNHHIPVFALGSVITDIIARFSLHQSFLSVVTLGLCVAGICCIMSLFRVFTPLKRTSSAPKVVMFAVSGCFLLQALLIGFYFLIKPQQPIVALMEQASYKFHEYSTYASASTLNSAVEEYHRRYGRPPPPGFDIWVNFAMDRRSKVIHEYDQIVEDLRPFWAIPPRVLRERVARIAGNDWNGFSLITVRDKKVEIQKSPQHRVPPIPLYVLLQFEDCFS